MKFGELKSIGHNIADSFASGTGLLIGYYEMNVFAEAANSPEGYILVNFITGTSSGARPSAALAKAVSLYSEALSGLCERHGIDVGAFSELKARYSVDPHGRRFVVTVQNQDGRRSVDEYFGVPGKRVMELDELGRVRPKRPEIVSDAE